MSTKAIRDWNVDEVCSFIESLGLNSLVPAFKENAGTSSSLTLQSCHHVNANNLTNVPL